jgi:hypothetical protein
MDLGGKLLIVFIAFVAIIGVVMAVSFRERKLANRSSVPDQLSDEASDARTMTIIFGSIICGMLLAILVAWLVFFQ